MYSVNPIIFAVLYLGTFIPCWYFVFRIVDSAKKKDFNKFIWYSIAELFLLILPYIYVLVFGKNLPVWFYIFFLILALLSIVMSFKTIAEKINAKNKSLILWNFYTFFYKNLVRYSEPHYKMFMDAYVSLNIKDKDKILDAGCGAGDFEDYLMKNKTKANITAIDFSIKLLNEARKRTGDQPNINFQQLDLVKVLPFSDNYFDGIVMISVLFSLPDTNHILKELRRIIKKNGRIVIIEPKPEFNMGKISAAQLKSVQNKSFFERVNFIIKFLFKIPLIIIIVILNIIMNRWAKEGYYKYYSTKELAKEVTLSGMKIINMSNTLANQDNLITAKKF